MQPRSGRTRRCRSGRSSACRAGRRTTAYQQECGKRQRVAVHHPLPGGQAGEEVTPDGRQGDADDGRIVRGDSRVPRSRTGQEPPLHSWRAGSGRPTLICPGQEARHQAGGRSARSGDRLATAPVTLPADPAMFRRLLCPAHGSDRGQGCVLRYRRLLCQAPPAPGSAPGPPAALGHSGQGWTGALGPWSRRSDCMIWNVVVVVNTSMSAAASTPVYLAITGAAAASVTASR
jgi:hypothetical protein